MKLNLKQSRKYQNSLKTINIISLYQNKTHVGIVLKKRRNYMESWLGEGDGDGFGLQMNSWLLSESAILLQKKYSDYP